MEVRDISLRLLQLNRDLAASVDEAHESFCLDVCQPLAKLGSVFEARCNDDFTRLVNESDPTTIAPALVREADRGQPLGEISDLNPCGQTVKPDHQPPGSIYESYLLILINYSIQPPWLLAQDRCSGRHGGDLRQHR